MEFNIRLTAEHIELIGSLLDDQPFKLVYQLSKHMQSQIDEQIKAAGEAQRIAQQAQIDALVQETLARSATPDIKE